MSRFLLVELEPALAQVPSIRDALFQVISHTSGVHQVIDLSVVSPTTLDVLLLAEPVAVQRRRLHRAPNAEAPSKPVPASDKKPA